MKLVTELTGSDTALMHQAVDGFVPDKVFDAHAHLFHTRHFAPGKLPAFLPEDTGFGFKTYHEAVARWLPDRKVEGLFFPFPSAGNDRDGENNFLAAELATHRHLKNTRGLALAAPQDDPGKLREFIKEHGFVGLKPYRLYAPFEDTTQVYIRDFAPEWMWQLCHEIDGVLMLHIMRTAGIADEANLRDITELCTRYPRCRLVLAHVARSFSYRTAFKGLKQLEKLENVVLDNSAVTESEGMRCALEVLGPRRLLWGSDYMVSELRGKAFTMGDGFCWVYADELPAKAVTQFDNFTLVGIEGLLALREACDATGMNRQDIQDIFHDNGLRLIGPHLASEDRIPEPRGPELWTKAKEQISCGTGLLSKRAHQYDAAEWPSYFTRCQGSSVWDAAGRRFTDFAGGVGAILLGYGDDVVNAAVKRRVDAGSYCTLVSPDELELSELLLDLHPWAHRVRFGRGGGEALAQAVRIARAATGRSGIAFCGYHGWSDWYLAANLGEGDQLDGHLLPGLEPLGVPRELAGTAVPFRYNDPASLEQALAKLGGNFAAVVMEPMRTVLPRDNFLQKVVDVCHEKGAVFVLDEVTSGWRFGMPGAHVELGITPDVAVYAKAMSNGFPCAAIVGNRDVMDAANSSFISSSYWTDGVGSAAALACIRRMREHDVQKQVWNFGTRVQEQLREVASRHPSLKISVGSMPCAPSFVFGLDALSAAAKTLCVRHMLSRGFLFSSQLYIMWSHTEAEVAGMLEVLDASLAEVARTLEAGRLREESGVTVATTGFARLV